VATVAIIPARGGSKRIPRKNVRDFAGMPMIAHSILAAQDSGSFDRIIVSTDDQEITDVALAHGAEVPFRRPSALADDHATTTAVVQHAVQFLVDEGTDIDYACCIYATAPFVTGELLREGLATIKASGTPFAFSIAEYPAPIQRALRIRPDGILEPFWPDNTGVRSQDLETAFHDAGQFYWGSVDAWLEAREIHSATSTPVILPAHRVQDIDTPEDWVRAELMFTVLRGGTDRVR
jgi:pseudaminic acid cytidylyltransferase